MIVYAALHLYLIYTQAVITYLYVCLYTLPKTHAYSQSIPVTHTHTLAP